MKEVSIYGNHEPEMEAVAREIEGHVSDFCRHIKETEGFDLLDHVLIRIKSEESMREKCRRRGLPETTESALMEIHDAIGVRVVCPFRKDVYRIVKYLRTIPDYEVIEEKDYIRHAKDNGYRSYHVILRIRGGYFAEVQLRTVSMDTWAALEHLLKYKKDVQNTSLIQSELKRCADELASTDVSMQTIRDLLREGEEE